MTTGLPVQPHNASAYGAGVKGKLQWLADARRYLLAVGQELHRRGFTDAYNVVRTCKGGDAVPGEVTGRWFRPGAERGVYLMLFQWSGFADGICRRDGVRVLARWTEREVPRRHTATGPNMYFNPSHAPCDLTRGVLQVLERSLEVGE